MHRQIAGKLTSPVTKWIVLAAWVVVFGVAGMFASKLTDVQNNEASSWLPASAESTKALDSWRRSRTRTTSRRSSSTTATAG